MAHNDLAACRNAVALGGAASLGMIALNVVVGARRVVVLWGLLLAWVLKKGPRYRTLRAWVRRRERDARLDT
jgi:hypothetical protein